MDNIRNPFSRLKKKLKYTLRGIRHIPDRTGSNVNGERVNPTSSPLRPVPHVVADSGHNRGGNGTNADGRQVRSTARSRPESVPGGDGRQSREADVDEGEANQKYSRLDPDAEAAVGSGRGGEVERPHPSPSAPSIPQSRTPDKNVDTSTVPNHAPAVLRPDESAEQSAAAESKSNWKSNTFATAKLLLRGVRDSADAFGPLKSVAGGLCFILENCERTKANKEAIESLAPRVKELAESLCKPVSETDVEEHERRKKLEQKLEDVRRDLAPLEEQGKVEGFFANIDNAGKLCGLVADIHDAMMRYQTSLQQDIYNKSCQLIESTDITLLNGMQRTADAGYLCGNRQGCLRGTRKDVLRDIGHWLTGEQEQRVFWLNGLAGTGKSTIAQTFAEIAFANGKLGASFFCSRDFVDRSNLQAIFPTLAFQLAYRYPPFRKELLQALRVCPDVRHESLCSQMEKLIVGPLKTTYIPTLIIIDALDECKDDQPASAILSILSRYVDQIPDVKFFITGRPEVRIRSGFRLESLAPITKVLKLHEVKPEAVDGDIELFFWTELASLAKNRSDFDLTEGWPSSSDVGTLCKKAAGFFIYASTVVKFVASESDPPAERLALITSLPHSTTEEGKSGVDQLYIKVLQQAFCGVQADNSQHYLHFQAIVGTVLLAFNPLSVKGLSDLLEINTSHIRSTLRSLHSLLLVPDAIEDPIRIFHKSFPDFLMDPGRCEDKQLLVKPTVHHAEILLSCLRLMGRKLKSICNPDDHTALSEVKNLSTYQKDHIGDALEYACCFWTKHLLEIPRSSPHIKDVENEIEKFFTIHLLHWIETLVLTRNLGVGVYAMNDIEQWCTLAEVSCKWINDSQRFLLEHFDTIDKSPSHIYHSALPFLPSSSWLCNHYSAKLSLQAKVVKGLPTEWGTCSHTISFNEIPFALSSWKNTIAVGLDNNNIITFNTITGSQTANLSGHIDRVVSLTFSSDGASLVSGSGDKTVKLWDVQTGGIIKTFLGHNAWVFSVSISADCTRIASGSKDETIRLWDIQTRECHCVIKQQDWVDAVCFSPTDPQLLLSISDNKVWQLDINSHQISPRYDGSNVAFSLDGTQVALWDGEIVTVQDSDSGIIVTDFEIPDCNNGHFCFSPDGRLIAVAADDNVYIWDIVSGEVESFIGHTESITSLAFSSPTSLISSSRDKSVKFWQIGVLSTDSVETDSESMPPTLAPIMSITLQAKDGVTITSDSDGVVRTWDISTGLCNKYFQTSATYSHKRDVQLIGDRLIFVWHTGQILVQDIENGELLLAVDGPDYDIEDLRISGDGSRVFCLDDESIQAWSIQTGELVGRVEVKGSRFVGSLTVDGSKVWLHYPQPGYQGWDFGALGSSPVHLSNMPILYLNGTMVWDISQSTIKDTTTGKVVFQLSGRFANPVDVQCDGCYLVAGYNSGEILILDFNHVFQ